MTKNVYLSLLVLTLAGCAGGPPKTPFPAFIQVDELPEVFLASLPGVRAKSLAGDPMTRRTSNRVDLPAAWRGTSGGAPGRSQEIFVLAGKLTLADIELGPDGYAYLPAGSLGFNMSTYDGARILYSVSDDEPEAVIRSPIIIDTALLEWQPTAHPGMATKELRKDPGTGATTWLLLIEADAAVPWASSSAEREGYLVSGDYQHVECALGEELAGQYAPGGYFLRPAGIVNGGPLSGGPSRAMWFLRESRKGSEDTHETGCQSP
ncbi:MAG TPA: DUF4437 domain-containing protein [Woeseiaceae bacterium]|jgi:hypothetical protein|nr:DUF4437 domain-containing protein [Woeseiaceae bacterium]